MSPDNGSRYLVELAYGCTSSVSNHVCLRQRKVSREESILHNILRGRGGSGGGEGEGEGRKRKRKSSTLEAMMRSFKVTP